MKLPRNLSGEDLVKALSRLGYTPTRQRGSHIRLTHTTSGHHLTIPAHDPLKPGTLNAILRDLAAHLSVTRDQLLEQLFPNR